MGHIEEFRHDSLHKFFILNEAGEHLARVVIDVIIENEESWDHLRDDSGVLTEPAGAHNRGIISKVSSYHVSVAPPHQIHSLTEDQGQEKWKTDNSELIKILGEAEKNAGIEMGGKKVNLDDQSFPEQLVVYLEQKLKNKVTIQKDTRPF